MGEVSAPSMVKLEEGVRYIPGANALLAALHFERAGDNATRISIHMAYLPPGGQHMRVIRDGARWRCRIDDGPAVNRHKPAVDDMGGLDVAWRVRQELGQFSDPAQRRPLFCAGNTTSPLSGTERASASTSASMASISSWETTWAT